MLDAEHHALIDSINVPGGLVVAIFFLVTLTETNSLHLKMGAPWKRRFLLETIIFWFYVSFREGTQFISIQSGLYYQIINYSPAECIFY